jgi:hypothetical protein
MYLYCDDIALIYNNNNYQEMEHYINEDLRQLSQYFEKNNLILNTEKTKYIIFNNKTKTQINITYKNSKIECVNNFSYLGMYLDNKLKFDIHIKEIKKKIAPVTGLFKKISKNIPEKIKRQLFFNLFQSKILYGINTWGTVGKTQMEKIQIIQNKAIKNLYNLKRRTNTNFIHKKYNYTKIYKLYKQEAIIHTYNIKNKLIRSNIKLNTGNDYHMYHTRHNTIRALKTTTNRYGKFSPINNAINIFNDLPANIRNCPSKKEFLKSALELV